MASPLRKLQEISTQIRHLEGVLELLDWDSQTGAPDGGVEGRAAQAALLSGLMHRKLSSSALGRLLDAADQAPESEDFFNSRLIRFFRREYEINKRVPAGFVSRFTKLTVTAQKAWEDARSGNDFKRFAPFLHDIFRNERGIQRFFFAGAYL